MTPAVKSALSEMGVTETMLASVRAATSQDDGVRLLEEVKNSCKQGFRKVALKLHPDVNGGDTKKTDHFRFLKSVYESFMEAEYKGWRKETRANHRPYDIPIDAEAFLRAFQARQQRRQQNEADKLSEVLHTLRRQYERQMRDERASNAAAAAKKKREANTTQASPDVSILAHSKGTWLHKLSRTEPNLDAQRRRERKRL